MMAAAGKRRSHKRYDTLYRAALMPPVHVCTCASLMCMACAWHV